MSNNFENSNQKKDNEGSAVPSGEEGMGTSTGSGTASGTGASGAKGPTMTFSAAATGSATGGNSFDLEGTATAAKAIGADISELQRSIEEAKSKAEENWNLFVRTRADMDNFRRRAELDTENARKYGMERFVKELLAVVDSLEHGLAVAESEHDTAYREGMQLTLKLLLDTFDKFGIVRIDPAVGDPFDPNKHEAISLQSSSEVEPNKILVVAQKGFQLHDRVMRPARVVVSKAES